jgi:hypothetical protein
MSLIPTADQGAPSGNYFALRSFTGMVDPVILPSIPGVGSAKLIMNNGVTDPSGAPMYIEHYVTATTGGGLSAGHYQCFMYGPSVGSFPIGQLFDAAGVGNGYCIMSLNRATPLDPARMGKITGTGAPQTVNVPSILAGSLVNLAFVAGTPAAADVAITIVPNTNFSLTLPAGAVYNYEVVG